MPQPLALSTSFWSEVTLNPASVAAATTASQNFTVKGLRKDRPTFVNWKASGATTDKEFADLNILDAACYAKDTLKITFVNSNGASARDAGSQKFIVWQL